MNITLSPENVEFLRGPAAVAAKRLGITFDESFGRHVDAILSTFRTKIADDSNDTVGPETVPCDRCNEDCTELNAKIGSCSECLGDRGE